MIQEKVIQQAVENLRIITKKYYEDSSKKKPLLENEKEGSLFLQITLKKIPRSRSIKMIKVYLPHRILKDTDEVCLIAGDLDKSNHKASIEEDILFYKDLLKKEDIANISEILTLRQLRTEYKPYEAKQKLLGAYDIFLTDDRITECLPRVLGRHFFKKRKFPIQINMKTPNLKQQIEKALSTKVFYVTGHGNSCCSEVAYLDMEDKKIVDNIVAVAKTLSTQLPGSWDNIMGVYLRTSRSIAFPLYMSYDNPNNVQLDDKKNGGDFEIDELTTIPNMRVKVYSDGRVEAMHFKEELLEELPTDGNESEKSINKVDELFGNSDDETENVMEDEVGNSKPEALEGSKNKTKKQKRGKVTGKIELIQTKEKVKDSEPKALEDSKKKRKIEKREVNEEKELIQTKKKIKSENKVIKNSLMTSSSLQKNSEPKALEDSKNKIKKEKSKVSEEKELIQTKKKIKSENKVIKNSLMTSSSLQKNKKRKFSKTSMKT